MSKANAKSTATDAAAEASTAPAGDPTADLAAAVVHATPTTEAAPAPQPTEPDEHHGHGGLFTVVNGQRVLTERTAPATQ